MFSFIRSRSRPKTGRLRNPARSVILRRVEFFKLKIRISFHNQIFMRNFLACLSGAQMGWINEIKECQKISWGGGGGFDGDDDFGGSAPLPIPHHISVFVLGPPATELTLTISSVSSPLSLIHLQVCADRPAWQIFCADISFD